jgi:uncharacterized membrane protein
MKTFWRYALSALFLTSGTLHFVKPESFEKIVPPGLPDPPALVAISGAAEIAGALGILLSGTRRPATLGLIALLAAVFPANVYMALAHERFASVAPAWLLVARLPLQPFLMILVWTLRE